MQDAFGFGSQFAGFDNFLFIFSDPSYLTAFKFTIMYSFVITLYGAYAAHTVFTLVHIYYIYP